MSKKKKKKHPNARVKSKKRSKPGEKQKAREKKRKSEGKKARIDFQEKSGEAEDPDYDAFVEYLQKAPLRVMEQNLSHAESHRRAAFSGLSEKGQKRIVCVVNDLVEMCGGKDSSDPEVSVFLGEYKREVREFGEELRSLGGMDAMRYAVYTVRAFEPGWGGELERAFDGIGDWLA